jgi:hypothetical protein
MRRSAALRSGVRIGARRGAAAGAALAIATAYHTGKSGVGAAPVARGRMARMAMNPTHDIRIDYCVP